MANKLYQMTPKEIVQESWINISSDRMKPRSLLRSLCGTDTDEVCFPKKCSEEITPKNILMMGPTGMW